MSGSDHEKAAERIISGAWVKATSAILVPLVLAMLGVIGATSLQVTELKAATAALQKDLDALRRSPAQVIEEERRLSNILNRISTRLAGIEARLGIESPRE